MEGGLNAGAGFVGEDLHGVSVAIGGENSVHSAGSDALSGDQVIEQRLCIGEEFLGLFSILLMLQNGRIAPAQFPGVEERRPVDVGPERFERNVFQDADSGKFRVRQVREIEPGSLTAGLFQTEQRRIGRCMVVTEALVFVADLSHVGGLQVRVDEVAHHRHGAAGI